MSSDSDSGCGCTTLIVILVVNVLLGGLATEYVVEFWTAYFGKPMDVPFWAAAIAGLFVGEVAIPLAVLTWLISFAT